MCLEHLRPWWPTFLAMRLAAGSRVHDLARWFVSHPNPEYIEPEPPWLPNAQQMHLGRLQAQALAALGLKIVPVWHFGPRLSRLTPLPVALFVRGESRLLDIQPAFAVVGSRHASADAMNWAYRAAQQLSHEGHVVVSGGARGIDTAAHRGALAVQGRTLVFMGSAIDRPYPSCNRDLFVAIIRAGGALVSEYPPLSITYKSAHAMRNRLIAAQANGVIVAEAAQHSGSWVTARWARRLNTPVYVSPEPIGQRREGINNALAQGWAHVFKRP